MNPRTFTDRNGDEITVSECGDSAHVAIDDHYAYVEAADLPAFTAALYEAAGKPAPIILERPETPANGIHTRLGTVYPFHSKTGTLIGAAFGGSDKFLTPDEAREVAAALATYAGQAAAKEDKDVEELADLMLAEMERRGRGQCELYPAVARVALRWMREREGKP